MAKTTSNNAALLPEEVTLLDGKPPSIVEIAPQTRLTVLAYYNTQYFNVPLPAPFSNRKCSWSFIIPWWGMLTPVLLSLPPKIKETSSKCNVVLAEHDKITTSKCSPTSNKNTLKLSDVNITSEATSCTTTSTSKHIGDDNSDCDSDSEEEERSDYDSSDIDSDDDDIVQFICQPTTTCLKTIPSDQHLCIPPPPTLGHTLSFSSDESGFYDRYHSDWSDQDDKDASDNEDNTLVFDEGLWHNFEEQCCFNDLFKSTETTKRCTNITTNKENCTQIEKPTIVREDTLTEDTGNQTISTLSDAPPLSCKRVKFKPDSQLVEVHYIIAWQYAYRAARKGPWEQFACDRDRFQKRINSVNDILGPCLLRKLHCK